jgi:ribonuclease HII
MVTGCCVPDLTREQALWSAGSRWVAGLDEAGRGALAGPVVAGVVVLPPHSSCAGAWRQVRDSKLLSPAERERLEILIRTEAAACAIGAVSADEVDRCGIAAATRMAMACALDALPMRADHLLIDWVHLPEVDIPQTSWAKADMVSVSVAAASILAKVGRDRLLVEMDAAYPAYGFARHKGYGTEQHRVALAEHGPCAMHRMSFAPVAQCRSLFDLEDASPDADALGMEGTA